MREKTCCFTGHRNILNGKQDQIIEGLQRELVKLIEQGYLYFGAGGALGFDILAAQMVLSLKKDYPQIKLILVLPCKTQACGWDKRDIAIYEDIMARCDKFVYTSEEYTKGCMFKRNRHLVDNSSVCVCYLTETKGGTAYTVNYAEENNLRVINLK